MHLNSDDNSLVTSKVEYENFNAYKNQIFKGNIAIELKNYGVDFTSFQLEFIKVTPSNEECEIDNNDCKK